MSFLVPNCDADITTFHSVVNSNINTLGHTACVMRFHGISSYSMDCL